MISNTKILHELLVDFDRQDLIDRFSQQTSTRPISGIINQDDQKLSPWQIGRVAIVGNGGVIKKKKWGTLIDSFDRVVRFNHAIMVGGFEEYAGMKTTDLVINCHFHGGIGDTFASSNKGFTSVKPGERWVEGLRDLNVIYVNSDPQNVADRGRIPEACTYFKMSGPCFHKARSEFGLPKPPTVGFAMVACLVRNNVKPHLFGFSTEASDLWDHYFEGRPPPSGCHANDYEKAVVAKLHELRKITVYR